MNRDHIRKLSLISLHADQKYFFKRYGHLVSRFRRDATCQARVLHGIIVPPHERNILRILRWPFREYHIIGGRGIAKSFTVCSMEPTLKSEIIASGKLMSLSSSKFRGGKVIMEEALSLIMGRLGSQRMPGNFAKNMLLHKNGLKKETDRWYIPFSNYTVFQTVPTGNEETIRGLRAQELYLDEADNWDKEVISKIVKPFLAVGTDFEKPGQAKSENKIIFTGTVSHVHKDWAKTLKDRELTLLKKFTAYKALYDGDFETWKRILDEDNGKIRHSSMAFQRWDYTDLILPLTLKNHAVFYPNVNRTLLSIEINPPYLIRYDPVDAIDYIYTYPVEKHIPDDELSDGLTDFDTWAAEWRCQFIETSGNVFPFDLIEKATCSELLTDAEALKAGWNTEENGPHLPPLLYTCSDPCVLGVDPARTDDFTAFVIIRLGEMAKGAYDPNTGTGNTAWNNVIWAEQKRKMTIKQIADKIRELKGRYNLVVTANPEKACGIAIDARGAASGTTVRDELARPTPTTDEFGNVDPTWRSPQKIYDPLDKEYLELKISNDTWPGLRLLWTSDQINTELVSFSKGQLEASRLYIAKRIERRLRIDPEGVLNAGYIGVETLKNQLLAIQAIPTQYHQKYIIPGNAKSLHAKKDLFSAFIYAAYAARAHLATLAIGKKKAPVIAAITVEPGGGRFKMFDSLMKY